MKPPQSHWVEWLDTEIAIWNREGGGAGVLVMQDIRDYLASMLAETDSTTLVIWDGEKFRPGTREDLERELRERFGITVTRSP